MFVRHKDKNNDSNVSAYEIGDDYLAVMFNNSDKKYVYTYKTPGKYHVDKMKILAENGDGLNAYINKYCRFTYDKERTK